MLPRPSEVTRSASGPASSSRRHAGSEPPAGTSSTNPSRTSLPTTLCAALPLRSGARTIAPSCRCEAAESRTSWVSVSFIEISVRVATASRAVTTEAPQPAYARGADPRTPDDALQDGHSHALFEAEVHSRVR